MTEHSKVASEMRKLGRSNPELAIRLVNELIIGINERSRGLHDTIMKQEGIITACGLLLEQDPIPKDLQKGLVQTIETHLGGVK